MIIGLGLSAMARSEFSHIGLGLGALAVIRGLLVALGAEMGYRRQRTSRQPGDTSEPRSRRMSADR
jgi:hypothetical protein